MKPLFIPLKTEYFEAFSRGEKTAELRRYGARWNERTCVIGREVILSKGYGKHARLSGVIWKFVKSRGSSFGSVHKDAILKVFGTLDIDIACVFIRDIEPIREVEESRWLL